MNGLEAKTRIIDEDCRRIAENAEERAAQAIYAGISGQIERERSEGGDACGGTTEVGSTVVIGDCEEIHYWEFNDAGDLETRRAVEKAIEKYGLKMIKAFAIDKEPFSIGYPLYRCYMPAFREPERRSVCHYGPAQGLRAVFGRVEAMAEQDGLSICHELAVSWIVRTEPENGRGEPAIKADPEETIPDIFSVHRFVRQDPRYNVQDGTFDRTKRAMLRICIRIRYAPKGQLPD